MGHVQMWCRAGSCQELFSVPLDRDGKQELGQKGYKAFIIYYLSSFSLASAHAHGGRSAAEATLREVESCIKHFLPDLLQMLQ